MEGRLVLTPEGSTGTVDGQDISAWPFEESDLLKPLVDEGAIPSITDLPKGHTVVYGYSTLSKKSGETHARSYASGAQPGVHRAKQVAIVLPPVTQVATQGDDRSILRTTLHQPGGCAHILTEELFATGQSYGLPNESILGGAPVFHVPEDPAGQAVFLGFHNTIARKDELDTMWGMPEAYQDLLRGIAHLDFHLFPIIEGITPALVQYLDLYKKGARKEEEGEALKKALKQRLQLTEK